ncbi:hypothetical protein PHYBLDRAFT_152237 [Phycomyces blakesleeanus NRRL 1555(-)]|uniref:Cysteine-rich transmembrane CYSTM domain-containing protein n=2 Tax=Phycomyces blakesleeanus TaxID=4837 RepID=A0A167JTP0_PHYB8|nr:hypothetical protein PHYBLDRAFT_152237 [Phycomyces blakesleeanus NRRL 1555(-)]OAD66688.1 hypothetical protein PHYBLDRAFT_152237 [Phycomyces blakesleeanus NRRL 1555(-)]|eukprot:XP_018284728.1 hypothetical protein PHYBLDRAFT_152237 [Phycomyces blakesleeanus NRRL 1555(-)]
MSSLQLEHNLWNRHLAAVLNFRHILNNLRYYGTIPLRFTRVIRIGCIRRQAEEDFQEGRRLRQRLTRLQKKIKQLCSGYCLGPTQVTAGFKMSDTLKPYTIATKTTKVPDRYYTPQPIPKTPKESSLEFSYLPTPPPSTVAVQPTTTSKAKDPCCFGCILACLLCCAVKNETQSPDTTTG